MLRTYLNGRFGIYAMEMTSKQIVEAMQANAETARFTEQISPVLQLADIVKFAKMRTTVDENQNAYAEVRKLVELTKPVEETKENALATTAPQEKPRQKQKVAAGDTIHLTAYKHQINAVCSSEILMVLPCDDTACGMVRAQTA